MKFSLLAFQLLSSVPTTSNVPEVFSDHTTMLFQRYYMISSPLQTNLDRKKFARYRITSKILDKMHIFQTLSIFFPTHLQDCDGDQRITCDDYAMMHKNGGYNCGNSLQNTLYWKQYMACKNNIANTEGINI